MLELTQIDIGTDSSHNQLCYTRGSTIPLSLTLESSDSEALDLLLAQKAVTVRLIRTLVLIHKGILAPGKRVQPPYTETPCGSAVWWPSPHADSTVSVRALQGEIVLGKSLAPTAHLDRFEIHVSPLCIPAGACTHLSRWRQYKVVLLPFTATGFTSTHSPSMALQEIPVVIGTTYAHGPRPIAYSSTLPPQ